MEIVDVTGESIFKSLVTKKGLKFYDKSVYRNDVTKTIRVLPTPEYEGFFIAKFIKK
jgi:16S rRNA C967 or C1407 C5-methylase (RsmB/RsmF family)